MTLKEKLYILFLELCFCSCVKEPSEVFPLTDEDGSLKNDSAYIVVLGDIQEYTTFYMPYLNHTMNWIRAQKLGGEAIDCILQVGDVTNTNNIAQWSHFYNATASVADEILYITCTGNHDYDWDRNQKINDRLSTRINEYASFPLTYAHIVAAFEPGRMENIVVKTTIGDFPCNILVLEFGPQAEVVEWANQYVIAHPDEKFILMTHEFLTGKGIRIASGSYAERQFHNTTWSSPEQVWQNLVKDNDHIICVLCGHNGFSAQLFSENSAGREVPQILFNLQYQENGGDGWVQLWEFPVQGDSVSVSVYNTIRREVHSDPATSFKFRYRY